MQKASEKMIFWKRENQGKRYGISTNATLEGDKGNKDLIIKII